MSADDSWTPPEDRVPPPSPARNGASPSPAVPPRSRKGLLFGLLAGLLVLALVGGGASWYVLFRHRPEEAAAAYVAAWTAGDYAALDSLTSTGAASAAHTAVSQNLGVEETDVTTGAVVRDGGTATAPFTAVLSLSDAGEWSYDGALPLERVKGEWKIAFTPAALHPGLGEGQTLKRVDVWGERGHVLAADGSRLDTDDASGSIQMLVGEVGAATADDLERLGPAYTEGTPTGLSGVQRAQEETLAGTPSTQIQVVAEGEEPTADPAPDALVGTIEGTPGHDVTLSIDPAVQRAAATAITGQDRPTALVAIRPSTGEVLAAANIPGGFNRALEGQYPAGSTFKVVSYDALFRAGLTPDATMECPKTADVGGWPFRNAGDTAHGTQSVTQAFATSCNTALVQEVAHRLDAVSLASTAEDYGFNSALDIGVPTFSPVFPAPDSTTLLAAMSIGQGPMLTSPLHMATVPAAVADGSWRSPVLVTGPALPDRPDPTPIGNAERLRPLMRAAVTEGTAKSVGFTGQVHGKTGTAEYGEYREDEELDAHGWFVGYEGDVAFAVLVEDGESGSGSAAPLAKKFLDAL